MTVPNIGSLECGTYMLKISPAKTPPSQQLLLDRRTRTGEAQNTETQLHGNVDLRILSEGGVLTNVLVARSMVCLHPDTQ